MIVEDDRRLLSRETWKAERAAENFSTNLKCSLAAISYLILLASSSSIISAPSTIGALFVPFIIVAEG